jgi:hypothetical protein
MRDLFIAPLISTDNGDAENLDFGRLEQEDDGLHIAAARPGTVFVDDDLTAACWGRRKGKSC